MYELNQWQKLIATEPTPRQWEFLERCRQPTSEVMFGYGAGAGATTAMLLAALDECTTDGYCGLLLKKRYRDIIQLGGIADRLANALSVNASASFNRSRMEWTFSGEQSTSHLLLGSIEKPSDVRNYYGLELSFLGFDHLQQFDKANYDILRSRLRVGSSVTAATAVMSRAENAEWIPAYFAERVVSTMHDNPHLDVAQYKRSLINLDPVTAHALANGDWN